METFTDTLLRRLLRPEEYDMLENTAKLIWEYKPRPRNWIKWIIIEALCLYYASIQTHKAHRTWDEIAAGLPPSYMRDINHDDEEA